MNTLRKGFFIWLFGVISLFSQETTQIKGKLLDSKTKESIGFSTVNLKDGIKTVANTITKENGDFEFKNLPLQTLIVEIQFIGYKKFTKEIVVTNELQDLGEIFLENDSQSIEGVTVVKERSTIEQKADRKVVNVGKDLISSGNTASEILNNIPSVSVDPQSKEISLRGNNNVKVFVDGKPTNIDPTQLLQQIPSSSIKQIELITNPSAKYNPEGSSGIINLVLNKNGKDGFNGSINLSGTQGIYPKSNNSLNLNYRTGKVNLYTNYSNSFGKYNTRGFLISERPNQENRTDFEFNSIPTSHLIKVGTDFYINDNNTLSFFTNLNLSSNKGLSKTYNNYFNPLTADTQQTIDTDANGTNVTFDLNYKHSFIKKGETIEFQMNHNIAKNRDNQLLDYLASTSFNRIDTENLQTQINVDYVNPLSEKTNLEVGFESRIQSGNTNFQDIQQSQTIRNPFDYTRQIHAFYSNYSFPITEKLKFQAGARLEQFLLNANFSLITNTGFDRKNVTQNIFSVYPSVYLSYNLNDNNSFNLNYSRRVDRPSLGQLNPVREWTTPLIESRGNPALEPQYTNSFELNYTRNTKIGSITSAVFYRQINSQISRVISQDPNNVNRSILSYSNFDNNSAIGIELSGNLKAMKFWTISPAFDLYNRDIQGTVNDLSTNTQKNAKINVSVFNARVNNNFVLGKKWRVNLFGMYRGRDISLQFENKSMARIDLGATYMIFNNKGSITARFNDMFNLMYSRFDGSIPYKQFGEFRWESQTFTLNFNYNFGGGKNKELQRKQRDKNETQGGGMF